MKRISLQVLSGLASALIVIVLFMSFIPEKSAQDLPNIVIIMADDLGYGDFGCQGATRVATPNVDRLAKEGMRFTNFHTASSLCSPSRYSLMTGRYSWRTPLRSGVLTWFGQPLIEKDRPTIASLLKRNGYHTACIGKWHLGFDWALKADAPEDPQKDVFDTWDRSSYQYVDFSKSIKGGPTERGFDYYYGISASNNMFPFIYIENDRAVQLPTMPKGYVYDTDQDIPKAPDWNLETMDQDLTKKAVAVIDNHFKQNKTQPLFLYYPTSAIHRPCLPTFRNGKSRAGLRGDKIEEFDWIVSEVVKALKRNNVFDNTLLIVTSDNGGVPGDNYVAIQKYRKDFGDKYYQPYYSDFAPEYVNPQKNQKSPGGWLTYGHEASGKFRGFKSDAWEGGHRVPLIMRWPKKISEGTTNNNMICNTDFFATLSELAGDAGSDEKGGEDSYSFLGNILGRSTAQVRTSMTIVSGGGGAFVVCKDGWTYIASGKAAWNQTYYAGGPFPKDNQLYNLNTDPRQNNNLYKDRRDKVEELKNIIHTVESSYHSER